MSMGIDDILALAKTPEQREEIKESIIELMKMKDEDIDFSDIPRITDFSRFKPLKPRLDAMREHNLYVREMRKKLAD